MTCEIFTKTIIQDVNRVEDSDFDISWLRSKVPSFNSNLSGIWQPIWINLNQSRSEHILPLFPARSNKSSSFNPCGCSDNQINPDPLYLDDSILGLCSYCENTGVTGVWSLRDRDGNVSPRSYSLSCCGGACDTMLKSDDYIPKIPYLNHAYITGAVDSKHHREFPACNNRYLGCENFISNSNLNTINNVTLRADWRIQETISEIQYDKFTSQHDSEYLHNITYQKSKNFSSTCGNFIMVSLPIGSDTGNYYRQKYNQLQNLIFSNISGDIPNPVIPDIDKFKQIPYGFDNETYKNIFVNNEKLASYWKWNYSSGILCWYRYFDTNRANDERPIPGVDLYISPGDVFFARNDGPEPQGNMNNPFSKNGIISNCPSGLKVVQGSEVSCIIPSGSEFAYISANLYSKFYNFYNILLNSLPPDEFEEEDEVRISTLPKRAFMIAATLATAPEYDQITVDLLKNIPSYTYNRNSFNQIRILNENMLKETKYGSVSKLNYITNKSSLFDTIVKKYGAYLWIPPDSNQTLSFANSINASFACSLNFDLVLNKNDTRWNSLSCFNINGCFEVDFQKSFSYTQNIGYSLISVKTENNNDIRYSDSCDSNGAITESNYGLYSTIFLNSSTIKSIYSSNGCSVFSGIYPRVSQSSDTRFCGNCDQFSSFYLINNAEQVECANHAGAQSFCPASLAIRFNNSPPPNMNRPSRLIADGTKRLVRSYRGFFFNPYIDVVAFHPNNGIFINSSPFKLDNYVAFESSITNSNSLNNNPYVNFQTKDLGIKIYDLELEYLQSQNARSFKCKRFPVKETCKCLSISSEETIERPRVCGSSNNAFSSPNIFTPNLSTRFSPRLSKYGGFTQTYLNEIFGSNAPVAGGTVPILNNYISSKANTSKCNSSTSITLYNYVNTYWDISLNNLDTNAELYVTASENISITGPREFVSIVNGVLKKEPVLNSRRFTNKVILNDSLVLYAGQTAYISDSTKNFNIQLQNPFLEAAILQSKGPKNSILYPPAGSLVKSVIFSNRGDESTSVTLKFQQFFPSTKILFNIPPIKNMGNLTAGSFDPNKGLSDIVDNKTPIKNNTIYYSNELFEENQLLDGKVYYGNLDKNAINSINALNDFDLHKKLRLYLNINNQWYYYTKPNLGSFIVDKVKYPGAPLLYEYNTTKKSKNLPGVITSPVKKHINFNFIKNNQTPLLDKKTAKFPYLANNVALHNKDPFEIKIPGLRHYFMVPEIDSAINVNIDSIVEINSSSINIPVLKYGQAIKLNDNTRWICVDPDSPNNRRSYIFAPFTYYNQYYSDFSLNFKNISKKGYLYNSNKLCNLDIKLKTNNNIISSNTIIEKSIYVIYKTKDGKIIKNFSTEDIYIQPYTVFKLKNPAPRNIDLIDLFSKYAYLTIGQINAVLSETSSLLNNDFIPGKWGDVIDYDGDLLDPIVLAKYDISNIFPKTTYDNLFFKTIINNYSKEYFYKINDEINNITQRLFISSDDSLNYYCLLNFYNLFDDEAYSIETNKYHYFIPLMDLNILSDNKDDDFVLPNSGSLNIANITKSVAPESDKLSYDDYFWLELDNDNLKSTLVPSTNFFSETLRLDYPVNWLNTVVSNNTFYESNTNYRRYFYPASVSTSLPIDIDFTFNSSFLYENINRISAPYWKYPIYADKDDGTCENKGCFDPIIVEGNSASNVGGNHGIDKVGDYNLTANYRVARNKINLNITDLDNIPFIIGYDAGLYNTIGNQLPLIQRFELKSNNIIDKNFDDCYNNTILPQNYSINSMSPIFQSTIKNRNVSTQKEYPVDIVANEMLFRILYGESQYVNKKMYFIDNPVFTKKELIAYSDPKITAEDIYSQILYNYDRSSNTSMKISGSMQIKGIKAIGSTTNINIGDTTITLSIINENNKIFVKYINSNTGDIQNILIHDQLPTSDNYVVIQGDSVPLPDSDNVSIIRVGNYFISDYYRFSPIALEGSGVLNTQGFDIVSSFSKCGSDLWIEAYGNASINTGGECCCGVVPCAGNCWYSTTRSIPPYSLMFNHRQCVCGHPQVGRINFVPVTYTIAPEPCSPMPDYLNSRDCTPYDLGYCRKKNCQTCSVTLQDITEIEFNYDWKYCRTNFSLFGHVYRQVNAYTPRIIRNEPLQDPTYTGSREQTQNLLINSTFVGSQISPVGSLCGTDRFGGSYPDNLISCIPIVSSSPSCDSILDFTPGYWNGCHPCEIWGAVTTEGEGSCNPPITFTNPPRPATPCYVGTMFQTCSCPEPEDMEPGVNYPEHGVGGNAWIGPPGGTTTVIVPYGANLVPIQIPFGDGCRACDSWCHLCGVARYGSRDLTKFGVFIRRVSENVPYSPTCEETLCSLSYNNNSVNLNINNKIICLPVSISRCPNLTVNSTMGQLLVEDSIESNCDECVDSKLDIILPPQQIKFVTKTETRKCLLRAFSVCSANPNGLIGNWRRILNSGLGPGGAGMSAGWMSQCGGGSPEYVCGQIGELVAFSDDPTYDLTYECLEEIICNIQENVFPFEILETIYRYTLFLNNKSNILIDTPGNYFGEGASHIPLDQIIEGVVPGSVSTLMVESYNAGGQKLTRLGEEIQENISNIYVFYYTYEYIRPVTIQDLLRNDEDIVCSNNFIPLNSDNKNDEEDPDLPLKDLVKSGGICSVKGFPDIYSFNYNNPNSFLQSGRSSRSVSYTVINPNYYNEPCESVVSCYYTYKVFICGTASIACDVLNGLSRDEGQVPNSDIIDGKIKICDLSENIMSLEGNPATSNPDVFSRWRGGSMPFG